MRYFFALAALAAFPTDHHVQAGETSIYRVLDGFIASSAAFERCGTQNAALKSKFDTNYMVVSAQAAVQAREDHPFEPKWDLSNAMEGRRREVTAKVEAEIAKNGCASDGVRELLKLYEANANLGGSGK